MSRVDYYHELDAPVANGIHVGVTAFVRDEAGALLLIRRTDNDVYSLPGGMQQVGETVTHAVTRETKEETGVNVTVIGLIGIYSDPEYVISLSDDTVVQEFSICFRAEPYGGQVRVSTESSEVHWIQPENLDPLAMSPGVRLQIEHGLANREQPYYA